VDLPFSLPFQSGPLAPGRARGPAAVPQSTTIVIRAFLRRASRVILSINHGSSSWLRLEARNLRQPQIRPWLLSLYRCRRGCPGKGLRGV